MKRLKVSDLSGWQLDYWVARADGMERAVVLMPEDARKQRGCFVPAFAIAELIETDYDPTVDIADPDDLMKFEPSHNWQIGGPVLEREGITVECKRKRSGAMKYRCTKWSDRWSDTYLLAGLRAVVGLKFGNCVEPPPITTPPARDDDDDDDD